MDGVTILNTYMGLTNGDAIFLFIWGFLIGGLGIICIAYGLASEFTPLAIVGAIFICSVGLTLKFYPRTKHIQATLDQSASWAELTERYEVIRVDGMIITMIEKEKKEE